MSRKKINSKNNIIIVLSFIFGVIVTIMLLKYTPLNKLFFRKNNQIVTKIYEKNSLASSVEKIYDAVVVVQDYDNESSNNTGTGFIYKVDNKYGYIITNEHVISNSNEIKVILTSDEEIKADILGKDEYLDLAILRIKKQKVPLVASIGSSENVKLGDTVFTVGAPLGYDYRGSVTSGILSGKDRMVSISVSTTNNNDWIMKVLQIDASINPGNSGGPLLNANGEVIGICSLKLVDNNIEGMGFAIPIEYAMSHVETLEKSEKINWPILGIGMVNITDSAKLTRNNIKIPNNIKEGVAVTSVKKGTNVYSKLKKGDIITKINKTKTKDTAHLRYELYQHKYGETILITFMRNNIEKTTRVKLNNT